MMMTGAVANAVKTAKAANSEAFSTFLEAGTVMKLYGIDIETDDPCLTDKGASWVYGEGSIIVTGLYNAQTGAKRALAGNGGKTVKDLLLDPKVTLVGASIIYDLGWLCHEHGLAAKDVKCGLVDVAIAEASIDEYQRHSLDALAWKYLQERKGAEPLKAICERLGLKGDFRKHLKKLWDQGYEKEIKEYVISDADQPVRIWQEQQKILPPESVDAVITNFKLVRIVLGMKQRGVRIDMKKRKKNYEFLKGIQDRLQAAFERKYGKVNFNSPKQLAELFDRQGIPYRRKIRIKGWEGRQPFEGAELWDQRKSLKDVFNGVRMQKGQLVLYTPKQYAARTADDLRNLGYAVTCNPSIDKKALDALKKTHEAAKDIVDLKQVTSIIDKFLGPRFDRFIVRHGPDNYRVHADFNIVGARQTGRFSSANPNLQQVPSKTVLFAKTPGEIKLYRLCREVIVPDDGCLIGKCDYSGQENRLMAHFAVGAGAEEIRRKYNENPELDFHRYIGEISGLYEEYGPEIGRKYAKNCFEAHSYIETPDGLRQGVQLTGKVIALDGSEQYERHAYEHRPGYAVELSNGAVLKVTRDHKFKWFDKKEPYFAPIAQADVGKQLGYRAVTHFGDYTHFRLGTGFTSRAYQGDVVFDEDFAYFAGLFVGDGSVSKQKYGYSGIGIILHRFNEKRVTAWLARFGKPLVRKRYPNGAVQYQTACVSLGEFLKRFFGASCKKKEVPEIVFSAPKSVQLAFIAGLIDSDGRKKANGFETFSTCENLIRQEALLIMSLGYRASLYKENYEHTISCGSIPGKVYKGILYRLICFDCQDIDNIRSYKSSTGRTGNSIRSLRNGWYIDRAEFTPVTWTEDRALYYYLKGQTKTLTEDTVERLSLPHADYRPVTIVGIKKIRSMPVLIMETDTHYFRAIIDSPNCSFGLGYGMQLQTMMETFGWKKEEAERITALYHEGAPFVRATMDRVSDVIVKRGYIKTLAGRRCRLKNGNKREAYKGFNKLVQGSASDMTKKAMVELDEGGFFDVFPLYLTVHDEIDFAVPKKIAAIMRLPEIQEVMEHTFPMTVPIRVDPEVGVDWGHVKGRTVKKIKIIDGKEVVVEKTLSMEQFLKRTIKEAKAV